MSAGQIVTGRIKWQDHQFIALQPEPTLPLVLLNREQVVLLRSLG
jgi:hypothetical protein